MKWQYAVVEATRVWRLKITLYLPDGTIKSLKPAPGAVTSLLNQLGAQGWEVVASAGGPGSSTWTLKRAL